MSISLGETPQPHSAQQSPGIAIPRVKPPSYAEETEKSDRMAHGIMKVGTRPTNIRYGWS